MAPNHDPQVDGAPAYERATTLARASSILRLRAARRESDSGKLSPEGGVGRLDAPFDFASRPTFAVISFSSPLMAGSIFAQMNQQTRTSMARLAHTAEGGIQAGVGQDTNNRSAGDVVGQIERIGDQPERSQIGRRFGRSGAGSVLLLFAATAMSNTAEPRQGSAQWPIDPRWRVSAPKGNGRNSRSRHTRRGMSRPRRPVREPSMFYSRK